MNKYFVAFAFCFSIAIPCFSATTTSKMTLNEMKMAKRFGVGVAGAGNLAVIGIEVDINLTEDFTLSGGVGTGVDYNSAMLKGKYYLLGQWVSPYFALGINRWWTGSTREKQISPSILRNDFLEGKTNLDDGFSVFILAPAVGVQFMHPSGFALSAEVQYLFKLFNLANGTYAGLGVHWYL